MMEPEEEISDLTPLALGAEKLMSFLWDVQTTKNNDSTVEYEVEMFVNRLIENIDLLKKKFPKSSAWAIDSLKDDLERATASVESCLKRGSFRLGRNLWEHANIIKSELKTIRGNLVNAFQVKLFIAAVEVALDGEKKLDDFQSKMLELSMTTQSPATRLEIRKLLQPLVLEIRHSADDAHLKSVVTMLRSSTKDYRSEDSSSETRQFMADVLSSFEVRTEARKRMELSDDDDLDQYNDPLTFELMCDPVKCTDGRTYDRWTIIDNNLTRSPFGQRKDKPFVIAFDDVDVRARLFQKFQKEGVEAEYRRRRHEYREKALRLADQGDHREALKMLDHVLEWTNVDTECEQVRLRMKDAVARALDGSLRQRCGPGPHRSSFSTASSQYIIAVTPNLPPPPTHVTAAEPVSEESSLQGISRKWRRLQGLVSSRAWRRPSSNNGEQQRTEGQRVATTSDHHHSEALRSNYAPTPAPPPLVHHIPTPAPTVGPTPSLGYLLGALESAPESFQLNRARANKHTATTPQGSGSHGVERSSSFSYTESRISLPGFFGNLQEVSVNSSTSKRYPSASSPKIFKPGQRSYSVNDEVLRSGRAPGARPHPHQALLQSSSPATGCSSSAMAANFSRSASGSSGTRSSSSSSRSQSDLENNLLWWSATAKQWRAT